MTVKVWFLRRDGVGAILARALLFSPWDQTAIEYDNVFYLVDPINGVITLNRPAFENLFPKRTFSTLRIKSPSSMVHFLSRQLTKPMDKGIYFPRFRKKPWTDDGQWFSSELIAIALRLARCPIDIDYQRCTPRQLWYQLPKVVVSQYH